MKEVYIKEILKNKQNRYEHITKREREIISKHLLAGRRISYIAKALNRSKSSISEEIKRGWYKGKYVPSIANERSLRPCSRMMNSLKAGKPDKFYLIPNWDGSFLALCRLLTF